jgi:hypothetical protein
VPQRELTAERLAFSQIICARSAMSMLTFYINRAGDNLSVAQSRTLEAAKDELRALFDRD